MNSAESSAAGNMRFRRRTINKPAFAVEKGQKRFFFDFFRNKNIFHFNFNILHVKIIFIFLLFSPCFPDFYAVDAFFAPPGKGIGLPRILRSPLLFPGKAGRRFRMCGFMNPPMKSRHISYHAADSGKNSRETGLAAFGPGHYVLPYRTPSRAPLRGTPALACVNAFSRGIRRSRLLPAAENVLLRKHKTYGAFHDRTYRILSESEQFPQ